MTFMIASFYGEKIILHWHYNTVTVCKQKDWNSTHSKQLLHVVFK